MHSSQIGTPPPITNAIRRVVGTINPPPSNVLSPHGKLQQLTGLGREDSESLTHSMTVKKFLRQVASVNELAPWVLPVDLVDSSIHAL
jgi:hypothetical protein